jgi:cell division initiation protein
MKITPIEIRQHSFQKVLRGFDVEEVTAFLTSLSNEWERVLNENKMLKMQLEIAEKDLNKLREVELTMFRMIKTAEDTSSQMTEQAKNAAEQYIGEARQKGEELINEARKRANMLVADAENQVKYTREEVLSEFKNHERDFKAMEKYRDNLIVQLKALANNTADSVERFEKKFSQATTKEKINDMREQVTEVIKATELAQKEKEATIESSTNAETAGTEAHEKIPTSHHVPMEIVENVPENMMEAEVAETESVVEEEEVSIEGESEDSVSENVAVEEPKQADKKKEDGSFFDQI